MTFSSPDIAVAGRQTVADDGDPSDDQKHLGSRIPPSLPRPSFRPAKYSVHAAAPFDVSDRGRKAAYLLRPNAMPTP